MPSPILRFVSRFICILLIAGPSAAAADDTTPAKSDSARAERPNILFVLTDDQGWPTLGCYGGDIVPTPHLDRLAAEGARLTSAYVTSQCTPTRASLLTGQYTSRHRMWHVIGWYGYPFARMTEPLYTENLPRDSFTVAKGLQNAGYRTGIVGKWHVTNNEDGTYRQLRPHAAHHYGFDFAPPPLSEKLFADGGDRGVKKLTEQALQFVEQHQDEPWFCLISHHMIHGKVVAPPELTEKYRKRGYTEQGPFRATYLAGLECIDLSIGRIVERLEQLDELDETLIVFISDNGGIDQRIDFKNPPMPLTEHPQFEIDIEEYDNTPLRAGKGSVYEGGVRVPCIVRWPRQIPPRQVIDTPIHIVDLTATMLSLAGASAPDDHPLDGIPLGDLLKGNPAPHLNERPIFQYYPFYDLRWGLTPCASVRLGDYKLLEFFGDRFDVEHRYLPGHHVELYNLSTDIGETTNLAAQEPQRTENLLAVLHEWLDDTQAEIPTRNSHYDPAQAFAETHDKPPWLRHGPSTVDSP